MRFHFSRTTAAWSLLSIPSLFLAVSLTGCEARPDDPEVKKQIQARRADINKAAEEDSASLRKRGGRKGAILKDIKGSIGGGTPDLD
jgi:hypothetical protein